LRDISFPTISAFGPHAAIPHYRVSDASNLRIGAACISSIPARNISTAPRMSRAPCRSAGRQNNCEIISRACSRPYRHRARGVPQGRFRRAARRLRAPLSLGGGARFDHGVGHGVGAYLSVHEGPQRISKFGTTALEPGMILSNEPGYYRAGEYGIRLENLVIVEPREIKAPSARCAASRRSRWRPSI